MSAPGKLGICFLKRAESIRHICHVCNDFSSTERMLATLETGIEGGKGFRLIDKVWSPKNRAGSLQKVVAKGGSAGIDNQSARAVCEHQEQTIQNERDGQ
jgi:hypothetical protein